jgi:hypothetical protein
MTSEEKSAPHPTLPRMLSPRQVADVLGVSTATLLRWRRAGLFPAFTVLGPQKCGLPESVLVDYLRSRPFSVGAPQTEPAPPERT